MLVFSIEFLPTTSLNSFKALNQIIYDIYDENNHKATQYRCWGNIVTNIASETRLRAQATCDISICLCRCALACLFSVHSRHSCRPQFLFLNIYTWHDDHKRIGHAKSTLKQHDHGHCKRGHIFGPVAPVSSVSASLVVGLGQQFSTEWKNEEPLLRRHWLRVDRTNM